MTDDQQQILKYKNLTDEIATKALNLIYDELKKAEVDARSGWFVMGRVTAMLFQNHFACSIKGLPKVEERANEHVERGSDE